MLRKHMPKRSIHLSSLPPSRYSYDALRVELQKLLKKKKRGAHKQMAHAAQLTASQLTKKMNETEGERLHIEHLGLIADWAQAPEGYPLVSFERGMELRDAEKRCRALESENRKLAREVERLRGELTETRKR